MVIGPICMESFENLGVQSIQDLANFNFISHGQRQLFFQSFEQVTNTMNINKGVDKIRPQSQIVSRNLHGTGRCLAGCK